MKFLFVCQPYAHHFAEPYLAHLLHARSISRDARAPHAMAEFVDVVWLEWANAYTTAVLSAGRLDAFTIVRIHDWEIRTGRVKLVPWEKVDAIWFINPEAQIDFNEKVDVSLEKQFFLPNAVDLGDWPLCAQGSKHLGLITANVQPRKALQRAVDLMELLPIEYKLTIRTSPEPHPDYPAEVESLRQRVHAFNFKHGDRITMEWRHFREKQIVSHRSEVVDFWRDKSHALSVAEHEGFCYGVAEGMACGAAGAVLNWEWGMPRTFYRCVEDDLEDLAQLIVESVPGAKHRKAIERFSAVDLAERLEDIIYGMQSEP